MPKRAPLGWLFWLVLAFFAGCSFDDRTLSVTDGRGGTDTSGGSPGSAGEVTAGGSNASAGSGDEGGGVGLAGGEQCRVDADCKGGPCLDGICCAAACDGVCKSCSKAVTGKPDGSCEGVEAGTDPHDDCAQGKAICGLDGQCDGAGACRFAPPSTTCGGEAQCNAAKTGVTPAPTCNGAGACEAGPEQTCGAYACDATNASCKAQCSVAADCAKNDYCAGNVCKPKLANGGLCGSDGQCSSGVCGGRCCASAPCDCPQPSPGNVIQNSGFDKDLSSWHVDPGPATINWQPGTFMTGNMTYADGHTCPYSGAAYVSNPDLNNNSQNIWQCVPVTPQTDYNFGVQQATLSGANVFCSVDLYLGPGCTGGVQPNIAVQQWLNVGWSPGTLPTTFNTSFGVTAKVYCYVEPNGSFFFDDIYLTPAPGLY